MRSFIAMLCLLAPTLSLAGEKAFITGNTRLIHKPFSIVEPYIGKPNKKVEREAKAHQWLDWGDGSKNMFYQDGIYTKFYFAPVKLVSAISPRDPRSGPEYSQGLREYQCDLQILVDAKGKIAGVSRRGNDCDFDLSRYLE